MHADLPLGLQEKWVCLLRKCREKKDLPLAKRLYSFMRENGLDVHPVLCNYLVPMFVDCGSLSEGQFAFDRLPLHCHNVHSWTSLIAGYVRSGDPHHAFALYHSMQEPPHFVSPNIFTFLALLDVQLYPSKIHCDIVYRGFDKNPFSGEHVIGNSLVNIYCKHGSIIEALCVFDQLPSRDTVSWNALIAGYAEKGMTNAVRSCFHVMQLRGSLPDSVTLISSLKGCCNAGALDFGQELHAKVVKMGLERKLFLGSLLVDMYAKCDSLAQARHVFDSLPVRDAVSWNVLMMGLVQCDHHEETFTSLKQMQLEGMPLDDVTFICALKACSTSKVIGMGRAIHAQIIMNAWEGELHLGNTIVDMYVRCGSLSEACHVFFRLSVRDLISWNAILAGYAECCLHEEVYSCLQEMQCEGILPDPITYVSSLNACCNVESLKTGQKIHFEAAKCGLESELYVGSALTDMYTKCGCLTDARRVFDRLPSSDIVIWNVLIGGYSEHGMDEEVLECFHKMCHQDILGDATTFLFCLKACGSLGALEIGRDIHAEIRRLILDRDLLVVCMLIDMYGRCGSIAEAKEVFDHVELHDTAMWNALLKAYGENHEHHMVVQCFSDMQEQHMEPDILTFASLLAACSHASLISKGHHYFRMMTENYSIEPTSEHHACIVDLLARSGHLYEADRYIEAMQCFPSNIVFKMLLSACRNYGYVELGQRCFQQLLEAGEEGSSGFLLMADIFADAGRLRDCDKLGELRNHAGAKKKPGSASVELNKKLYNFTVGVSESQNVLERTNFFMSDLKIYGYVPHIDCQDK